MDTEATGIFASDLILRHAILQGIKELRANPWLLDFVCAGIKQDTLTSDIYGDKEAKALRDWFLKTDIPVIVYGRLGDPEAPSITINLVSSTEDKNSFADVHYQTQEDVADAPWPNLSAPFTPLFDITTGLVTVPISVTIDIFPGMVIVDAQGTAHGILSVESNRTFTVEKGKAIDFSRATIRAGSPSTLQTLESAVFSEQYLIGAHVAGEPRQLVFLHSALVFILLHFREELLEGRGLENTHLSSSDFAKNQSFDVENIWSRYVTLTGLVRSTWPKRRFQKIAGVNTHLRPIGSGHLPPESQPVEDQIWIGDADSLGEI